MKIFRERERIAQLLREREGEASPSAVKPLIYSTSAVTTTVTSCDLKVSEPFNGEEISDSFHYGDTW